MGPDEEGVAGDQAAEERRRRNRGDGARGDRDDAESGRDALQGDAPRPGPPEALGLGVDARSLSVDSSGLGVDSSVESSPQGIDA